MSLWITKVVDNLIKVKGDKQHYVCASGVSPSGSAHIGNFREVATSYFVAEELKRRGKDVTMFLSWDDYDRLRKVPKNVANIVSGFEQYVGCPISQITSPFDSNQTYAKYFEKQFEKSLKDLGVNIEYRYQHENYLSGKYTDKIIECVQKRKEIYDIIMSFKTQEESNEERENYFPINLYCSCCNKDTTKIIGVSEDGTKVTYKCSHCGKEETVDLTTYHNVKLVWKLDWPMRWQYEGVDFEPGGKDHSTIGGSYDVCSKLAREIFGIEPPCYQPYEWIGILGYNGAMHSSSGINYTPEQVLEIYQPEIIRWIFAKYEPTKAFDFGFDSTTLKTYFEFDRNLQAVRDGVADDFNKDVFYFAKVEGRDIDIVPFGNITSFAPIVNFNADSLERLFEKMGTPYKKEQFAERLEKAKYWLTNHCPEQVFHLNTQKNIEYYDTLTDDEKAKVATLFNLLNNNDYDSNEMQQIIYSVCNNPDFDKKQNQQIQKRFFEIVYNLLISRDAGPRLYLFLSAINKDEYLELLNF